MGVKAEGAYGDWIELKRDLIVDGGCCPLVKSGLLRVNELERDVEMDRMLSDGSDGLCLMLLSLQMIDYS